MAKDTRHSTSSKGRVVKRRSRRRNVLFPTAVRGRGSWILGALTVPIMAIALLSASLSVALGEAARGWQSKCAGNTLWKFPHRQSGEQIFGHGDASTSAQDQFAQEVAGFLAESDEVHSVEEIPEADLRTLVEPWLGVLPPELNLPKLYEVTPRDAEAGLSDTLVAALAEVASCCAAGAVFSVERAAFRNSKRASACQQWRLGLGGRSFCFGDPVIVRATLASDRSTVRLLRQMGATDEFISREVSHFALRTGGLGSPWRCSFCGSAFVGIARPVERTLGGVSGLADLAFACGVSVFGGGYGFVCGSPFCALDVAG